MERSEIIRIMLETNKQYQNEKLKTVWEIFCFQNDIDEEDEECGKIFDELVENGSFN